MYRLLTLGLIATSIGMGVGLIVRLPDLVVWSGVAMLAIGFIGMALPQENNDA